MQLHFCNVELLFCLECVLHSRNNASLISIRWLKFSNLLLLSALNCKANQDFLSNVWINFHIRRCYSQSSYFPLFSKWFKMIVRKIRSYENSCHFLHGIWKFIVGIFSNMCCLYMLSQVIKPREMFRANPCTSIKIFPKMPEYTSHFFLITKKCNSYSPRRNSRKATVWFNQHIEYFTQMTLRLIAK